MNKYIIDANVLITANRRTYPIDLMPAFWDILLVEAKGKRLFIIDEVLKEINVGEDDLTVWLQTNKVFIDILSSDDKKVISSYRDIIQFVYDSNKYTYKAKSDFADVADSWLIAHGKAYNYTIVTEEVFDSNSKKRIIIPNICHDFGVRCINTIQFLRELKIKI